MKVLSVLTWIIWTVSGYEPVLSESEPCDTGAFDKLLAGGVSQWQGGLVTSRVDGWLYKHQDSTPEVVTVVVIEKMTNMVSVEKKDSSAMFVGHIASNIYEDVKVTVRQLVKA